MIRTAKIKITAASVIRKLLLAWLTAACGEYLPAISGKVGSLIGTAAPAMMSLPRVLAVTLAVTFLLLILSRFFRTAQLERWGILFVFVILATLTLVTSFRWAYLGGCVFAMAVLLVFAVKGWNSSVERPLKGKRSGKAALWVTGAITTVFFLLVSAWGVGRVLSFKAPTYDFGIFSQMFYSMRTSGIPVTTLEREIRMSHFYVHVSPIYYLMLPFYCLAPYPATLQILQAAVLASAVIPLWKIGSQHNLPGWQKLLLCLVLMLYPAFAGGTGYDLHENCFLTPLLLWLFYGIEKKRTWMIVLFTLLTLAVKEDAAVYTAATALWICTKGLLHRDRRELFTGAGVLLVSLVWFAAVTSFLSCVGDGVMTYRYENFIYDGSSSLMTVIKTAILCPMKVLYECLDEDKLYYIAYTLLPLFGIPFMTRRYERFMLLIPYVLVNLMSDYEYQHSLHFQYSFGSAACLLYLTALNLADMKDGFQRLTLLIAAAAVGLTCFSIAVLPTAVYYPVKSVVNREEYQQIRDVLSGIPEDAAVTASCYYTTALSGRDILYDTKYAKGEQLLSTDYVVLSTTDACVAYEQGQEGKGYEHLLALLQEHGYIPVEEIPGILTVFYRGT